MNKTVNSYCFTIFFLCMNNFKYIISEESASEHLYYKGKYTSDIKNYEVVVPQRVNKDGNFISHLVSHQHSKRSTNEMDVIFYKIPISGRDYLIELTPNRKLISQRAVVEIHNEDVGKFKERGYVNERPNNDTFGKMFQNLSIRQLKNTECHFSGRVKGENVSKAALSTCDGLAGFIQIQNEFYTIEPVAERFPDPYQKDAYPHLLYKTDGMENSSVCHIMGELSDHLSRERRDSNTASPTPMYIETLIVMDKSLINHHSDSDCENYVLTVFNMAFNLFQDASVGLMITLTIVRIIRLEVEVAEMSLRLNEDALNTLKSFQTWQYEINPGDDSHPNHHDIAVLLTRVNVCYSPSSCGLLGLTTIGKACDPKLSAALCQDSGLRLGHVIAHEIGHLLGADHDVTNSTCNDTDAYGQKTVMHPQVSLAAQIWSRCSQAHFKEFFDTGMGDCFLDEPEEHHFNVQDLLPGVMYDSDFQCEYLISRSARECDIGSTCESLNCHIPGYACVITHMPPADGTRCGENMWCHDNKCVSVGQRPGAIDGNWGEWSAWSDCSRTCGSGVCSASRNCNKPRPFHRGKNCVGERKRYKVCAATTTTFHPNISDLIRFICEEVNVSFVGKPCETGRPSFRDIQCGEFDDWIYPEDGKMHKWRAYYFHYENPCALHCISDQKQIATLRPRVVDGTMCYRGIRDICVGGICKTLPCDLNFESKATEDVCGVCHGDGTECDFSEGVKSLTKSPKVITKLVQVPLGSRNIRVEMTTPTSGRIVVRDEETGEIYLKGKNLGMYSVPGSQAWLGMARIKQQALNIPGPVTKPLTIWLQRLDNITAKWSMAIPAEQQRKPEFTWDFLKWGPCSAKCGPGTQKSEPSCIEAKAGLVEDTYCVDLEMPAPKVRSCEISKCEPRWMVGDWQGCEEPGTHKAQRKRVVYCIRPIGEREGESQIISDSECPKPKPHTKEYCENRKKREDTEHDNGGYVEILSGSPLFEYDLAEFGSQKKYEKYLRHFPGAISGPQRKSETMQFHLSSSPHFKHYIRALETPEDETGPDSSDPEMNLSNPTTADPQTQSSALPNFFKSTFSGKQTDVSPMLPKISSKSQKTLKPLSLEKRIKRNRNRISKHSRCNEKGSRSLTNDHTRLPYERESSCKGETDSQKLSSRHLLQHQLPYAKVFNNQNVYLKGKRNIHFTARSGRVTKSNRKGDSEGEMSSRKFKPYKPSQSNLTNLTRNMREENIYKNGFYSNSFDKRKEVSPFLKRKWRRYQNDNFRPKSVSQEFFNFLKSERVKWKSANFIARENGPKNFNELGEEFDGSDIRKLSYAPKFKTAPVSDKETRLKYNSGSVKNLYPNSHLLESRMKRIHKSINSRFKNRYNAIGKRNYSFEEKASSKNEPRMRKRVGGGYKKRNFRKEYNVRKRKRSSRKWKKSKPKDSTKDPASGGCGETRNYMNDLFRDSHSKASKQEPQVPTERPVIRTGEVVIDKDLAEDQGVELFFQVYDDEENCKKCENLAWTPKNEKRVSLRGQEVFDLFSKLQQRCGRGSSNETLKTSVGEGSEKDKVEVSISIGKGVCENKTAQVTETACTTKSTTTTTTKITTTTTEQGVTTSSICAATNAAATNAAATSAAATSASVTVTTTAATTSAASTSEPTTAQTSKTTELPVKTVMAKPEEAALVKEPSNTTLSPTEASKTTGTPTKTEETKEKKAENEEEDEEIDETVFDLPEQSTAETKVLKKRKKKKKKKIKERQKKKQESDILEDSSEENEIEETWEAHKKYSMGKWII